VPKSISEFTIVGKQKQALGIGIESANVEEPFLSIGHEVTDALTTSIVGHRRHHTARLVHGHDHQARRGGHTFTVYVDHSARRVNPGAEFGHRLTVYAHATLGDQGLGRPPTRDAGLGENLLQADALVGTIHRSSP
jgi:hypothetical protein